MKRRNGDRFAPKTRRRPMVFVAPEDAKQPPKPHRLGLACKVCGTKTSSAWRGPNGEWCNLHVKEAKAAREALAGKKRKASESEGSEERAIDQLKERVQRLEADEAARENEDEMNADIASLQRKLKEQGAEIDALREQVARLAQQHAYAPH